MINKLITPAISEDDVEKNEHILLPTWTEEDYYQTQYDVLLTV